MRPAALGSIEQLIVCFSCGTPLPPYAEGMPVATTYNLAVKSTSAPEACVHELCFCFCRSFMSPPDAEGIQMGGRQNKL